MQRCENHRSCNATESSKRRWCFRLPQLELQQQAGIRISHELETVGTKSFQFHSRADDYFGKGFFQRLQSVLHPRSICRWLGYASVSSRTFLWWHQACHFLPAIHDGDGFTTLHQSQPGGQALSELLEGGDAHTCSLATTIKGGKDEVWRLIPFGLPFPPRKKYTTPPKRTDKTDRTDKTPADSLFPQREKIYYPSKTN